MNRTALAVVTCTAVIAGIGAYSYERQLIELRAELEESRLREAQAAAALKHRGRAVLVADGLPDYADALKRRNAARVLGEGTSPRSEPPPVRSGDGDAAASTRPPAPKSPAAQRPSPMIREPYRDRHPGSGREYKAGQ